MKRLYLLLLFLFLFSLPSVAFAQKFAEGETTTLPKNEIVNSDYFAAGDTVTISGTVNGDVYVAGSTIIIDGTVNGDVLAAGGNITISGTVTDDVRLAGGNVTLSGNVGKNVTLGTGNGTITSGARIGGSVVGGAGNLTIMAPIGKNAVIGGGTIVLGNVIKGNVTAGVGNLNLTDTASISGTINYTSENEAEIHPGASLSGQIVRHTPPEYKEEAKQAQFASRFIWEVMMFLITLLFGYLLLFFIPRFVNRTVQTSKSNPLTNFGVGLLMIFITPLILLLLTITLIGIPFAILWLVMFIVDLLIAKIFIAYLIGERTHQVFHLTTNRYLTYLTGLFIYKIITFIPVFGPLFGMITTLIGFGALLVQKKATYSDLRAKGEI